MKRKTLKDRVGSNLGPIGNARAQRGQWSDPIPYDEFCRLASVAVECDIPDLMKAQALRYLVRNYPGYALRGLPVLVLKWCQGHQGFLEEMSP